MRLSKSKLSCMALSAMVAAGCVAGATAADWSSAGKDLKNSRYQADEKAISPATAGALQLKWAVNTDGDVTANPAVDGNYIYFPDSAGSLYKVHRITGALAWKKPISQYTGIAGDYARATPAVAGDLLILGNQAGKFLQVFGQPAPQPARVFAVNKHTGAAVWSTQVDSTQLSFVTNSAIVHGGVAYVGTASNEELVAAFVPKAYWQWHFRGATVALDVATGAIKWKTYTVPQGYYGGSIWSSTGAVDRAHGLLYMSSGNNTAVPQSVLDCLNAGGAPANCMSQDNHFDSIIAMDLATGAIRWGARGLPYDAWNVGCGLNVPGFFVPPNDNCPTPSGPDYDFAQGPMLFGGNGGDNEGGNLVGAGQKSGMFWAFNAKTGRPAWSRQVAPGGVTGGLQWGSSTDGRTIWAAAANAGDSLSGGVPKVWTLMDGSTTTAGGWAAMDAKKGDLLWTRADPLGGRSEAAVSSANGVIFGCSKAPPGTMYAMNAATGAVLWSYNSGGFCNAGASVADGMVYWGSGTFQGTGVKKVFAFGL